MTRFPHPIAPRHQTYHLLAQLSRMDIIVLAGDRNQIANTYIALSAAAFDKCLSMPYVFSFSFLLFSEKSLFCHLFPHRRR